MEKSNAEFKITMFLLGISFFGFIFMPLFFIFTYSFISKTYNHWAFKQELKNLAGETAENCGIIWLNKEHESALQCAQQAFKKNSPFYIAIERQGIDSQIIEGFVINKFGSTMLVNYDSSPSGNPLFSTPSISKNPCADFQFINGKPTCVQ